MFKYATFCLIALALNACAIYKPEQQQGNLLNNEQIAKLQVGMPKSQVQSLLGTPLLQDVFHANRWEYVYRQVKGDQTLEQRMFRVEFDANGKVTKWTGENKEDLSLNKPLSLLALAPQKMRLSAPELEADSANTATHQPELLLAVAPTVAQMSSANASGVAVAAVQATPVQALDPAKTDDVQAVLELWRSAWEKADFQAYMARYSPLFKGNSRTRLAWEADRKRMIAGRSIQAVNLSDISIQKTSGIAARAYFKQNYVANNFQQNGEKTLLLERIQGEWLIVSETFNKA